MAEVIIAESDGRRSAILDTKIYIQDGVMVIDGYAKVKLPKRESCRAQQMFTV